MTAASTVALAIVHCGFCGGATLGTSLCEDCIPYTWPFMEEPCYGRGRIPLSEDGRLSYFQCIVRKALLRMTENA